MNGVSRAKQSKLKRDHEDEGQKKGKYLSNVSK
jgi:hypothetical protein